MQTIALNELVATEDQPRQHFDGEAIRELADSMIAHGFLPTAALQVRPVSGNGHYQVLAGHRRLRAARLAGLSEVPCEVHEGLSEEEVRQVILLDNLNRQDFLPWEEGAGYLELIGQGMALEVVAGKAGKSTEHVKGRMVLAEKLCDHAREAYKRKELSLATLMLIAELPDEEQAPVRCNRCQVVLAHGAQKCAACGQDLAGLFRFPSGNPQHVAAKVCRNCTVQAAQDKIQLIKETYGLAEKPVQTSLGFAVEVLTEESVKARSALEHALEQIAGQLDRLVKTPKGIRELCPDQRAAVADQCRCAVTALSHIINTCEEV